jgi:curved DNA-binding protein CbpA
MDDLYEVLQIHPHARPEVARAAYRALARLYHPDLGGDGRNMTALNNAWAVLGDPLLRASYDEKRAPRAVSIDVTTGADGRSDLVSSKPVAPARSRHDQSTALDFGRYAGWTLAQLADADPNYLEWVIRTAIGRRLTGEVEELLGHRATAAGSGVGAVGTPLASRRAR